MIDYTTCDLYITVSEHDNVFAFTEKGYATFKPLFARIGINIDAIKSINAYQAARAQLAPNFLQHLANDTRNSGPASMEREALALALEGNTVALEKLKAKLIQRNRLGLKVISDKKEGA